ncbi:stretch-activated cation channel mid1 [Mortierella sp. NVP85]|nr:stretch-activated cation channel mid1 [Mortierella sp. NVP85]
MFHPGADAPVLEKRQQPSQLPSVGVPSAAPSPTGAAPAPLPSPLPNGTYAVFISISTCTNPQNVRQPLELYVSTSPIQDQKQAQKVVSDEGVIQYTVYTSKELFFWVASPTNLQGAAGSDGWIVEVGASTQGFVQGYKEEFGLVLDDTDNLRASFLTPSFADVPPFNVYVVETEKFPVSLKNSLCAVKQISPPPLTASTTPKMDVTVTSRASNQDGLLGIVTLPHDQQLALAKPRRQVLLSSLTSATDYTAIFVANVPNQAGAEVMYMTTPFRTKKGANCALVTDLKFCKEVAYAVPITPPTSTAPVDLEGVKKIYEDHVEVLVHNFENVLAQYDCSKSQYSLIRNCTDCQLAYRRWLCGVSIPRCTDVEDVTDFRNHGYIPPEEKPKADENPYLIDRSKGPVVVQRNTTTLRTAINMPENDTRIDPGDFGEVLPCIDLCFDVVQSCPNFLGFGCPVKNMAGNYATMNSDGFQCNGLGLVPVPSEGAVSRQGWRVMQVVAMAVTVLLVGV